LVPRQVRPVDVVRDALEKMKPQLAMALPKHLTADRLLRVAMTAVQNTPKLLDCDRTSLYSAIMTCAQLGLEPDGVLGQAYLVPYAGRVQFVPGYKGLITLARNSGEVATIVAREVCENDVFEYNQASGDPPHHPFSFTADRGRVIGFYAVAKFKDGSFQCEAMSVRDVEVIRDNSKGYRYALSVAKAKNKEPDTPWHNNFVEMGKKTVLRRLAKYLPMSVQKAATIEDNFDTGKHMALDSHGDLVIEGTAEQHEDTPAVAAPQNKLEHFEQKHSPVEDVPPKYDADPIEDVPVETGGHDRWIDNFNVLRPRMGGGVADWRTYAEACAYLVTTATREDLNALEVSKNPQLMQLRDADPDLYRSVTQAIANRSKELLKAKAA
jgi:recombination protein RecT